MTKKTTVSLANTPVRRALDRAKRSTLIILFILGIASGLAYTIFFGTQPESAAPAAVEEPRQ